MSRRFVGSMPLLISLTEANVRAGIEVANHSLPAPCCHPKDLVAMSKEPPRSAAWAHKYPAPAHRLFVCGCGFPNYRFSSTSPMSMGYRQVLRQMASGGHIERLACAETVLFRFAIRERKPAVYIVLKNRNAVGMRMHHRLLVCSVVDSEHAHLLIFDFHLVMFWVLLRGLELPLGVLEL